MIFNSLQFAGTVNNQPIIVFGSRRGLTSFWIFPKQKALDELFFLQSWYPLN